MKQFEIKGEAQTTEAIHLEVNDPIARLLLAHGAGMDHLLVSIAS